MLLLLIFRDILIVSKSHRVLRQQTIRKGGIRCQPALPSPVHKILQPIHQQPPYIPEGTKNKEDHLQRRLPHRQPLHKADQHGNPEVDLQYKVGGQHTRDIEGQRVYHKIH